MKKAIKIFLIRLLNFIFLLVYTHICAGFLINFEINGVGVRIIVFVFLIFLGIGFHFLQLLIYSIYQYSDAILYYLVPPGIFVALAIVIGLMGDVGLIGDVRRIKLILCMLIYGLIISIYHVILRYLYKNYFGYFTTTLVMIFSIPSIFWFYEKMY